MFIDIAFGKDEIKNTMKKENIQSLQVLRGLAALAVVIHHSIRAVTINNGDMVFSSPWFIDNHTVMDIGAAGVDIFFVLSGFLMFYISDKYSKESFSLTNFLAQRFIRVWPLYALVTTVICLVLLRKLFFFDQFSFDLQLYRLASFFFIPSFNESGHLQPILGVGWTLNYEILFYVVFAISLKVSTKNPLPWVGGSLLLLFFIGYFSPKETVVHAFLSNTIIFEFIFGALIGLMFKKRYLPMNTNATAIISGVLIIILASMFNVDDDFRFATTGVGAALIFCGMLTLNQDFKFPKLFITLGDASYSIYLVHMLFIYQLCFRVLYKVPETLLANINAEMIALFMTIGSVLVGILFYYLVEKPMLNWFKKYYSRSKPAIS